MTIVLLLLAGVWGVVIYTWIKDHLAEGRPADSIGSFRRQLHVLERTGPASGWARSVTSDWGAPGRIGLARGLPTTPEVRALRPSPSARRAAARRRRRDILCGLLAGMGGSLALSFLPGLGVLLALHVALDALFLAYVALLIRYRNLRAERAAKVRFLPQAQPPVASSLPEPVLALRRTGN